MRRKNPMERKECFGLIQEVVDKDGFTITQTRFECRDCLEFRDCMRYGKQKQEDEKERDEIRKQKLITQIIDLSEPISNEIGTCLLEFLNRLYRSDLGMLLFKNLILFWEVPRDRWSSTLTFPISPSTFALLQGRESEGGDSGERSADDSQGTSREGSIVHIVLIQRSFGGNRKANLGLIADEVAHTFSSNDAAVQQILQYLPDPEVKIFGRMDIEQRIDWLVKKWGFQEELDALRKEIAAIENKKD
jgi:hypothetical protein